MIGSGVKPSKIGLDSETRVFEVECDYESMGETMSLTVRWNSFWPFGILTNIMQLSTGFTN
jgi:hypothetical protein